MKRVYSFFIALSVASACAKPLPFPSLPEPTVVPREDVLPPSEYATVAIPLGVPLADLEALLRDNVHLPNVDDYQVVSEPGQSPEIAIRYAADLLTPHVSTEADVVSVALPIAYHGSFRARVKTPFGWAWLTKGTDWGTPEARGRIDLTLAAQINVASDWTLSTQSELRAIHFTAPPIEQLCTRGVFKVCVPAAWAEERVHRELESRVRDAVTRGLARVDAVVQERSHLPELARNVWDRLNRERALVGGETLDVVASQIALAPPSVRESALVADVRVWCRPHFGLPTGRAPNALPPPASDAWPGEQASLQLGLAFSELDAAFESAVSPAPFKLESGQRITSLKVIGSAADGGRYFVAIAMAASDGRELTAFATAGAAGEGASLRLQGTIFTPDSSRLLALARVSENELAGVTERVRADVGNMLNTRVSSLRAALSDAIAPWPTYPLATSKLEVRGVYAAREGVVLDARVH